MQSKVLDQFGWSEYFARLFDAVAESYQCPGRVVFEDNVGFRVQTEYGELQASLAGRLRHEATARQELPSVGDWVVLKAVPSEMRGIIQGVLQRQSCFVRKAAGAKTEQQIVGSNIDTIFLVNSLNQDFNLRRIERYLTLAWESGSQPVVVLTKSDLCTDVPAKIAQAASVARDVGVHAVSLVDRTGLESLSQYLKFGETVALLGSSGVGKSSLANYFIGFDRQVVKEIRVSDDRGQHATRRRELILLPQGGLLLDTPGMRELQLWEGSEGVQTTFDEIEELALSCYFGDCKHDSEPRCAVRDALAEGRLGAERFESYMKLQSELRQFRQKHDQLARRAEKQQVKKIGHLVKDRVREKRSGK